MIILLSKNSYKPEAIEFLYSQLKLAIPKCYPCSNYEKECCPYKIGCDDLMRLIGYIEKSYSQYLDI